VVLDFAGQPIERVGQLSRAVAVVEPGKKAELVVWRNGKEKKLEVAIGTMPTQEQVAAAEPAKSSAEQPKLGLALAALTPEQRDRMGLDAATTSDGSRTGLRRPRASW
jgi:serine protease Do